LALAVGRTAGAVRQLPDMGLIVRMTRGRVWIGVLGILLVGIVGLNVVTLSFAASSGKIDEQIQTLEAENSSLSGRVATLYGTDRIRNEAAKQNLRTSTEIGPRVIQSSRDDVEIAAQRLSGAG
jgi:Tfp pilus assembly protein PilN